MEERVKVLQHIEHQRQYFSQKVPKNVGKIATETGIGTLVHLFSVLVLREREERKTTRSMTNDERR